MSKEVKEWFKVIEIADLLGLSKVSIYNRIKAFNIEIVRPLQRKEKGITYYNYKIIDMIRDAAEQQPVDVKQEIAADSLNDKYIDLYIKELRNEIDYLKEQVRIKDDQLRDKDDLINRQVKLVENEQILRREESKVYALSDEQTEPGFFTKWFKKNRGN